MRSLAAGLADQLRELHVSELGPVVRKMPETAKSALVRGDQGICGFAAGVPDTHFCDSPRSAGFIYDLTLR